MLVVLCVSHVCTITSTCEIQFVAAFVIFDEAGREKDLQEIPAPKLKVNWTQKSGKDVVNGRLPDIKVKRIELMY